MWRLSWIILVAPKCHHMYPYKRDTEEHLIHRLGGSPVIKEAETGAMQPQAKDAGSHQGQEGILPLNPLEGVQPC